MSDSTSLVSELIAGLDAGAMVTKYVVVAEVIDTEGQRAVWVEHGDTCMAWDLQGLLSFALTEEFPPEDD